MRWMRKEKESVRVSESGITCRVMPAEEKFRVGKRRNTSTCRREMFKSHDLDGSGAAWDV